MKQDMIVILDLGSTENTVLAREIRAMGVYSEIYPHDITKEELEKLSGFPVLPISAKEGRGMEELGQKLEALFYTGSLSFSTVTSLRSERQIAALEEAKSALELVLEGIRLELSEDFLSIDLMGAYSALGRILGEDVSEDLINEIFAKFCMGK